MKIWAGTILALILLATTGSAQSIEELESTTLFAATPLMDLTTGTYKGFQGGLYPNGSDTIPTLQAAAGLLFASAVQPLDSNGNPNPAGKIVLASIGMSNALEEFGLFIASARANTKVNHTTLAIVNGASANMTACYWTAATGTAPCPRPAQNQYDRVLNDVLKPAGLSEKQVQVVWIKNANPDPGQNGCGTAGNQPCQPLCNPTVAGCANTAPATEAVRYEEQLGQILRAAKTRWPNLRLAFLASRAYAGYATVPLNPEPYAYEYGFSVKWLIAAQITQIQTGVVDSIAGDLNSNLNTVPWVAWGPYLWANGPNPRSDGLAWCDGQTGTPCMGEFDFDQDGTHPSRPGGAKVVNLLMNFFTTSPFTAKWFNAGGSE